MILAESFSGYGSRLLNIFNSQFSMKKKYYLCSVKMDDVKICVFGASSGRVEQDYVDAAYQLGALMARRGWTCVDGAGAVGLMRAVADGVLDSGGHAIGVIPKFMVDNGWCYDRLAEVIITPDMHQRKQQMADMTDAVIAMPGGCGTLEELLEAITWRQLGLNQRPIVMLNTRGYYDPLVATLQHGIDERFMKESHHALWTVASTPLEAVEAIERELRQCPAAVESKY